MAYTIEELQKSIDELSERVRQARIEKGLPPEPPEDFIEPPLSIILAEQLKPFLPIWTQYTSIIASGRFIPIDMSKLDRFREPAELLKKAKGRDCATMAVSVIGAMKTMEKVNETIAENTTDELDSSEIMRRLHGFIRLFNVSDPWDDAYDCLSDVRYDAQVNPIKAEYNRLKSDEEYFEYKLAKARAHYESIKHLI